MKFIDIWFDQPEASVIHVVSRMLFQRARKKLRERISESNEPSEGRKKRKITSNTEGLSR